MDRNQVRFALLKLSFAVLAATTWLFSSFIYATRPEEQGVDALTTLVRLPASLPAQLPEALPNLLAPTTKPLPAIRMDALAIPCWDKLEPKEHETPSRWIRLTGKPCQTAASAEAIRVQNLANGYVATVFTQGAADLTTDFIPLENGKNEIIIRFETEPGARIENKFTLMRD
jgi:hypothetical protein